MRDRENMYNVDEYSDQELMDILDLFNPTDRELEMKIISFIRKYDSLRNEEGDRLATFFRNIYSRFFDVQDDVLDEDENEEDMSVEEGFTTSNVEGSGSSAGVGGSSTTGVGATVGGSSTTGVGAAVGGSSTTTSGGGSSAVEGSSSTATGGPGDNATGVGYDVQLTTNLTYAKGRINPLLKETVKRIISIDSQYRDSPKSLSTDFTLNFNETLKDVVSLKLYAVQIPYNWYTISQNYGSNFLYIKGISPGVNDGNHDFKIAIDPGNYDQNTLTTAIQASIANLPSIYPDVSFGSTQLIYNKTACLATYQIDIQNVFNESSYSFHLDGPLYYPYPNINRLNHLGAFLGFNYADYSLSTVFSSRKIISTNGGVLENTTSRYSFDSLNSVINVIQYAGPGELGSTSTIYQNLAIQFPIKSGLTQKAVFDSVNSVLAADKRFVNAFVKFSQIVGTDVCGNTIQDYGNYRFEWNFKLNRNLGNNIPGSKICLVLPQETNTTFPIWVGGSRSCFYFDASYNELNNLVSESLVSTSNFKIIGNVYYSFVLNDPNYNVNGINDLSYAIPNSLSGYSLTNYLTELNNGISQLNARNLTLNGSNIFISGDYNRFYANDTDSKLHIKVDMTRYFHTENFVIDISGTVLQTILGFSTTDLNVGVNLSDGMIITGSFGNFGQYNIDDVSGKKLLMKVYANPKNKNGINPNWADLSYNIYMATGTYNIGQLISAVNLAFGTYSEPSRPASTPFTNMLFSTIPAGDNYTSSLKIDIEKVILENEYNLHFYDAYNSWNRYLYLDASYSLANYRLGNYSDISGSTPIVNDTIIIDASGASFHLTPLDISSGDLSFNIPGGTYNRTQLFNKMNELFSLEPVTSGTTVSAFSVGDIDYTKIRWNINKVYTTADYQLVFYDLFSFVSCFLGNSSVRNATWDTTLGWITGFRSLTNYSFNGGLSNVYTDINSGSTYYTNGNTITKSPYKVTSDISYRTIVYLTGDTTVSVNLYNYFMVILDDYNQNHLNDGLITISPKDNNLELPSYANRYSSICDPTTGQALNVGITSPASNKLTQNQLYSINQIVKTQNTKKGYTNSGVFVKDIFGLIPIKTTGMAPGSTYVELGGTLQNQDRIYFGPVNIHRMAIKLMNDRGDIVDLNGANWSLQFVCEQLYQSALSNNTTDGDKKKN